MFPRNFLILFIVLAFVAGTASLAGSENPAAGQEQTTIILPPDWQKTQKSATQDQYQFFAPGKLTEGNNYLILDDDGNTPADYQKILSPLDQYDKKPPN